MLFSRLGRLGQKDLGRIMERSGADIRSVFPSIAKVIGDVEKKGDEALRYYTEKFDKVEISDFRVSPEELEEARKSAGEDFLAALEEASKNIFEFHRRQVRKEWFFKKKGARIGQIVRPVGSTGCYIPGGRASYPSTVLMTAIPALVAGVKRIVLATPPRSNGRVSGSVLAACDILELKEVYKVGGPQAIAALAFGTASIPRVDKIVGPGNIYVTAAKQLLSDRVGIDMLAGPSEILIIADESANPDFIALDMAAQAEHDSNSSSILITTSEKVGKDVFEKVKDMKNNSAILLADNVDEAVKFANEYAPEHLQVAIRNPERVLKKVNNAGSVFLGDYTPVACGDYASGTNHVLPTGGLARIHSALSVLNFVKFIPVQEFDKASLKKIGKTVTTLAEAEGLDAHAESVRERIRKL